MLVGLSALHVAPFRVGVFLHSCVQIVQWRKKVKLQKDLINSTVLRGVKSERGKKHRTTNL